MEKTLPATASGKEFARIAGFKPSYVTQLKGQGRLVLTDDGKRIRVAESLRLIEETRDPAKAAVAERHAAARAATAPAQPPQDEGDADDGLDASGIPLTSDAKRRAKAIADKAETDAATARIDLDLRLGTLYEAEETDNYLAAAAVQLRTTLERLPDTLAPQLAALTDETRVRALLWDEIAHALEELSTAFGRVARASA